jgi:hypothetical protein
MPLARIGSGALSLADANGASSVRRPWEVHWSGAYSPRSPSVNDRSQQLAENNVPQCAESESADEFPVRGTLLRRLAPAPTLSRGYPEPRGLHPAFGRYPRVGHHGSVTSVPDPAAPRAQRLRGAPGPWNMSASL